MKPQNHTLYSPQENWSGVTGPALVSMLPVPQRYYVPSRIRTSYKARLEAAELWHVPEIENEPEEPGRLLGRRKKHHPPSEPHKFKTAFEREKACLSRIPDEGPNSLSSHRWQRRQGRCLTSTIGF